MLQRVGLGQMRFNVPGLSVDSRGVATGRQVVLRFAALERLVSFLRLWSGEQSLDDFQPGLRLVQVRAPGGAREALVVVPSAALPLMDAVARAARAVGGQCFTGAGKHFVQYRDARAPLGYDATALEPADESVDFVLYGAAHAQAMATVGELPLDRLLLHLDLQRQPDARPARRDLLFLTVRRGLGPLVIAYLHRAERLNAALRVAAALCEPPAEGAFQTATTFWLARLEHVPERLVGILSGTPGLQLFVPVADNVAVALGYRHPVHLGSCKQVFSAERLFLFGPAPTGVTIVSPAPAFSAVADLVRLEPPGAPPGTRALGSDQTPAERTPLFARRNNAAGVATTDTGPHERFLDEARAPEPPGVATARSVRGVELVIPLRLEAAPTGVGRAVATLVPWNRAGWIRSLCYALPPPAVRGYRVAFLERGALVVSPDVLDAFPFGTLLHAPAPGVLVPLGWELRPAVSPAELAARAGASGGALVVFPGPAEAPFRVPAEALQTLEALTLADPRLTNLFVEPLPAAPAGTADEPRGIEIENQALGPMPLWRLGR